MTGVPHSEVFDVSLPCELAELDAVQQPVSAVDPNKEGITAADALAGQREVMHLVSYVTKDVASDRTTEAGTGYGLVQLVLKMFSEVAPDSTPTST